VTLLATIGTLEKARTPETAFDSNNSKNESNSSNASNRHKGMLATVGIQQRQGRQ
jgi:hypothetical protein